MPLAPFIFIILFSIQPTTNSSNEGDQSTQKSSSLVENNRDQAKFSIWLLFYFVIDNCSVESLDNLKFKS